MEQVLSPVYQESVVVQKAAATYSVATSHASGSGLELDITTGNNGSIINVAIAAGAGKAGTGNYQVGDTVTVNAGLLGTGSGLRHLGSIHKM